MYSCIERIAFNCYCINEHENITMCRVEHLYYRDDIGMVIINDDVKYMTCLEIRLPLNFILRIDLLHNDY